MKCFICKKEFSVKALMLHLKVYHSLKKDSEYKCLEENCSKFFSNMNAFLKHSKKHETVFIPNISQKCSTSITQKLVTPIGKNENMCTVENITNSAKRIPLITESQVEDFYQKTTEFSV